MSRTMNRSSARALYERFARSWRRDLRLAGLYGTPHSPKRPTFRQWYLMHERDVAMMAESTPQDVAEHVGDPWTDPPKEERGVVEIPIAGDDE